MEILCPKCHQSQQDSKLNYCTFCYTPLVEEVKHEANLKKESKTLLNNIVVSKLQKIVDDGKILSIKLKSPLEIFQDNFLVILFREFSLCFSLYFITYFLTFFIYTTFRVNYFYTIYFTLFLIPNLAILTKILMTRVFTINEIEETFVIRNFFMLIKKGKISELDSIMATKTKRLVKADKYNRVEYTVTTWKLEVSIKSGKCFFITDFSARDDGSETTGMILNWNMDGSKEGINVINTIVSNGFDKDYFNTFWGDTGQVIRNFAVKLSERLNLRLELINLS